MHHWGPCSHRLYWQPVPGHQRHSLCRDYRLIPVFLRQSVLIDCAPFTGPVAQASLSRGRLLRQSIVLELSFSAFCDRETGEFQSVKMGASQSTFTEQELDDYQVSNQRPV